MPIKKRWKILLVNDANILIVKYDESYNFKGLHAIFCLKHADIENGMINVINKKCIEKNCNIQSCFNIKGEKAIYCNEHKKEGMINVKDKKCIEKNCDIHPCFNFKELKQGIYCNEHKKEGMINVKNKKCIYKNCDKNASFGLLFKSKIHCSEHRNNNEYRNNNPECDEENCKNQPFYTDNKKSNYPYRCDQHKLKDDFNIIKKPCKNCKLEFYLNEESLCNDCNNFINHKVHKIQETDIKNFLDSENIKYESADKIPDGACSKYRPDFVIDYGLFKVILEVDENQHKSYSCECELSRMIQLFQDYGGISIIFIRYNPDNYIDNFGKLHNSSNSRKKKLLETFNYIKIFEKMEYSLSVIYLFYDNFDGKINIDQLNYEQNQVLSIN